MTSPATPLQSTLLAVIAKVSNPPSGLQVGTAAYEDWAVKVAVGYFERAGVAVSETGDTQDAARYRWLREERDEQQPVVTIATFLDWGQPWRDVPLWGDELDTAVDKAMKEAP